jgi:hypothetical protein
MMMMMGGGEKYLSINKKKLKKSIDSEGSNSVEKNETHDTKIFALAALLASVFVLNSFGAIDEQSIQ